MYLELFLLDNLLMDWLILRVACALGNRPCGGPRLLLFAALGAFYAWCAVCWPAVGRWPCKLLFAGVLAFALPNARAVSAYVRNFGALLLSACLTGGLTYALACGAGPGVAIAALPLRLALLGACAAFGLPGALRRLRGAARTERLCVAFGGAVYTAKARVDTGNDLREPLSGRPVIVAALPALAAHAHIPIPARTADGPLLLYALEADMVTLDGDPVDALIAISRHPLPYALVPPGALGI